MSPTVAGRSTHTVTACSRGDSSHGHGHELGIGDHPNGNNRATPPGHSRRSEHARHLIGKRSWSGMPDDVYAWWAHTCGMSLVKDSRLAVRLSSAQDALKLRTR
jgi:hypothetical protein